jgi:hypothetical protein
MRSKGFLAGSVVWLMFILPSAYAGGKSPQADLARRIHEAVVAKMPRPYEDLSEWGKTILPPPAVRFPRLRRTFIRVGDHYELPHGTWKRTKVWIDDPDRDLRIQVPSIRLVDKNTTRLRVEATAALRGARERQDWVRGVRLLGVTAEADAVVRVGLDVDVTLAFDPAKPLDGLKVGAKVTAVQLELKEFNLRRVGPVVFLEQGPLGEELKAAIQERLKALEPKVKDYANRAIAEGLKDGKGLPPALGGR